MPPERSCAGAADAALGAARLPASRASTTTEPKMLMGLGLFAYRDRTRDRGGVDTGRKVRRHNDRDRRRPRRRADPGACSRHDGDHAGQIRDRISRCDNWSGSHDWACGVADVGRRIRRTGRRRKRRGYHRCRPGGRATAFVRNRDGTSEPDITLEVVDATCEPSETPAIGALIESVPDVRVKDAGVEAPAGRTMPTVTAPSAVKRSTHFRIIATPRLCNRERVKKRHH